MPVQIKFRRGTAAEWTTVDPILAAGEPGVELDTGKFKIGDGASTWTELGYAFGDVSDQILTAIATGAGNAIIAHEGAANPHSQYLRAAQNLADVTNAATARSNLGAASVAAMTAGDAATLASAESYADSLVLGLLDDRGSYDASANLWPDGSTATGNLGGSGASHAIKKGDLWTLSVAGTLGGTAYSVGTMIRALVDSPGQTAGNWAVAAVPFGFSPENQGNKATAMSGNTTSNVVYLTAKAVYDWATGLFLQLSGGTMAGILNMAGYGLKNALIGRYSEASGTATLSAGTLTLDFANGNIFQVTLTGNVTTVVYSNLPASGFTPMTLELTQDGTGGRTVAGWVSGTKWPGGTAPTITSAANAVDIITGYIISGGATSRLGRAHADSR